MSTALVERLTALKHDEETLQKAQYKLMILSTDDVENKRLCVRCKSTNERDLKKRALAQVRRQRKETKTAQQVAEEGSKALVVDGPNVGALSQRVPQALNPEDDTGGKPTTIPHPDGGQVKKEPMICRYHSEKYAGRTRSWLCCGKSLSGAACVADSKHLFEQATLQELARRYQMHPTPESKDSKDIRPIVAIDCEMGRNVNNERELIRVSLIDVVNGAVLLDSLVYPNSRMLHFDTKYSGVTRSMLETARARKECIMGRDMAREQVWRFVGPATLMVGHSANNDLLALRWIHKNILDTHILASKLDKESEAQNATEAGKEEGNKVTDETSTLDLDLETKETQAPEEVAEMREGGPKQGEKVESKKKKGEGKLSLKTLSAVHLGRSIQSNRGGHDSVEDARAAADLAVCLASKLAS